MLEVTPTAVDELTNILEGSGVSDGDCLRLTEQESGELAFTVGQESDGDQVVHNGDRPVLVVGERVAGALDGATLDFQRPAEGDASPQFTLSLE